MPDAPRWDWHDNHPMVLVLMDDILEYCKWLGKKYGGKWRLPNRWDWEFAAKGGDLSKGYTYSGSNNLDEVAWYNNNSGRLVHPVGEKKPNKLGLYDITGNIQEIVVEESLKDKQLFIDGRYPFPNRHSSSREKASNQSRFSGKIITSP